MMFRRIIHPKHFERKLSSCNGQQMGSISELTEHKYKVKRQNYAVLNDQHINIFKKILGSNRVITKKHEIDKYNTDFFKFVRGQSTLVLKPKSTLEVSEILKICNLERLAVCPQGGNTGVSGGAVPVFDEIVISMELMNKIESLDPTSGVIVCQAGCILENLEQHLAEYDLNIPLDLGAKGSCQIGGNIATNAGGLRVIRYGNLHGSVLGLEVVTSDGAVLDCLNTLRKDNTGYHLKHIFIGSEGTLGIITKTAIQCSVKYSSKHLAFLGVQSFEKALKVYRQAKRDLGEILSAVELMDSLTVEIVQTNLKLTPPIGRYPFYMIIETMGSNEEHDEEKLNKFLSKMFNNASVLNGVIASEPSKMKNLWEIREKAINAQLKEGFVFCYDFTLPIDNFYSIVPEVAKLFNFTDVRVTGFGHLGDGNLHLNVLTKEYSKEIENILEPFVYEFVSQHRGSISAEHGIGFTKTKCLKYSKNNSLISLMKNFKHLMDPKGILNPYKVLPN